MVGKECGLALAGWLEPALSYAPVHALVCVCVCVCLYVCVVEILIFVLLGTGLVEEQRNNTW